MSTDVDLSKLTPGGTFLAEDAIVLGEYSTDAQEGDRRFWSVTTMLKNVSNQGLEIWGKQRVADAAIDSLEVLPKRIELEGRDEVRKWLVDAPFRKVPGTRSASQLGTDVHDAIEKYTITGIKPKVDAEVQPFLDRFDEWAQLWQPVYIAAEMAVYSLEYGYAGTLDFILQLDAMMSANDPLLNGLVQVIGDYKTSRETFDNKGKEKKPYPDVGAQLAAYRFCDLGATWRARRNEVQRRRYYLLSEVEKELSRPIPEVDGGICLHITPDHCKPYAIRCDEMIFEAFLYMAEITRWKDSTSKLVVVGELVKGA